MKKKLIIGATAFCVLLGGSVTAFAASATEFSFPKDSHLQMGTFQSDIEGRMMEFETRAAEMKEKADASMVDYEQYGLGYNEGKGGYCYDGKLVGLLADPQGRGISYLSKNGEVHVKAIRDENGELTGLVELSEDEYSEVVIKFDGMNANIQERMNEMHEQMQERFQSGTFSSGNFQWGENGIHESMQNKMNQFRTEMEQRMNEFRASMKKN